jgi:hypothetical protein
VASVASGRLPSAASPVLRSALAKRAEKRRLRDKQNASRLTNEPRQRQQQCDAEADLELGLQSIQPAWADASEAIGAVFRAARCWI